MAGPVKIAILANGRQARGEIGSVGSSLGRLEGLASKAGRALRTGLFVGAAGAAAGLVSVTKAASAAQQSLGATETVFGKYADTVVKRSNHAATAIGLAANEYRELSNVTGAMLKSSGIPLQRVTALTADLQRRAADVAATFGGTTREAVEAFNALLRGETDPVERYGVAIKEADIAARLAAKGQDELTGAALKQAKAIARVELLFKQTAASQGQFRRESDTLAGQSQRLTAELDNLQAKVGTALLPALVDLTQWARREVVPALEDGATWFRRNTDEITDLANTVGGTALDVLADLADVAKTVAGAVEAVPGPVRTLGVEAAIAAAVLPKLAAGADLLGASALRTAGGVRSTFATYQQWRAELTYTATRAAAVTSAMSRLGGVMRGPAGIGGMLLLAQNATKAGSAMSGLATAAGGAMLGFSVAGAPGAVIGGVAGGLVGLYQATRDSTAATRTSIGTWQDYASTLDVVTGAITRQTRAMVYDNLLKADAFEKARLVGIGQRTLINAVLGEAKARREVQGAMARQLLAAEHLESQAEKAERGMLGIRARNESYQENLRDQAAAYRDNVKALELETGAVRESIVQQRRRIAVANELPRKVVTEFQTKGLPKSLADLRDLAKRADLTPKQIRTVVELAGVDLTRKQLKNLTGDAKTANDSLGKVGNVRPDFGPLSDAVRGGSNRVAAEARRGGQSIGAALSSGISAGISGLTSSIASAAASVVAAAEQAARREADSHSPSRKMMRLGEDMGDGLILGMANRQRLAEDAGRRLARSTFTGATRAYRPGISALDTYRSTSGGSGRRQEMVVRGTLNTPWGPAEIEGIASDTARREIDADRRFDHGVRRVGA